LNIVDTAVAAETFTTLVTALQATELDSVLADESKTYTVFAPTDSAFEKLGADTINALLGDTETLKDILLYHVVPEAAVSADAAQDLAGSMVEMANGDKVAVSVDGDKLFINTSEVVITDIATSNGVIHAIDTVLSPPEDMDEATESAPMSIVETAAAAGSFTTLARALVATGLLDTLNNPEATFTVFAPTDEAFAKLPEGTIDSLLASPDTLRDILLYHVITDTVVDSTTASSLAGKTTTMANGDDISISLSDGNLQINDATVISPDVFANNGVIHVIDTVLIPPTDAEEETTEPPVQAETPTGTILDIAAGNPDFSILAAAVVAAGLDGALGHSGDTYTVFAPNNAAFEALGQDKIDSLIADPEKLRNILLLHVLPGRVVDAQTALTLVGYDLQAGNGDTLVISQDGDSLSINGSNIVATDIRAVNGVIHVIDKVILPK